MQVVCWFWVFFLKL